MKRRLAMAWLMAMVAPVSQVGAEESLARDEVKGALSVMVLGSGGPVAHQAGRASAGYLIFTDGKPRILMDVGGGTFARIAESGVNLKDLDTVLLSHLHIDHTADMSAVVKSIYFHNLQAKSQRSAASPIRFFGPSDNPALKPAAFYSKSSEYVEGHYHPQRGLERYLHAFAKVIGAGEFGYKAKDIAADVFVKGVGQQRPAPIQTVFEAADGLKVSAVGVIHGPVPALAYRIDYKGKSIVYSGDTSSKSGNMIRLAKKADLLIYDTAIMSDVPNPKAKPVFHKLHTTPERIGEVAGEAGVATLLLSHLTPITHSRIDKVKKLVKSHGYKGNIQVAHDLRVINLKP